MSAVDEEHGRRREARDAKSGRQTRGARVLLRCTSVDLSENLLQSVPAALLRGLPSLTHLDVGGRRSISLLARVCVAVRAFLCLYVCAWAWVGGGRLS